MVLHNTQESFEQIYEPRRALLIYEHKKKPGNIYVESYDIDPATGRPINAHPLSEQESSQLGKKLYTIKGKKSPFLSQSGFLPEGLLHTNPNGEGLVVWHTPAAKKTIKFNNDQLTDGTAHVPALLWAATKTTLRIFGLKDDKRPTMQTRLMMAPFFNVSPNGYVCRGDVKVRDLNRASVNEYINAWHDFFWLSRFTHLSGYLTTKDNTVKVWQSLLNTDTPFPTDQLIPAQNSLDKLLL